MATKLSKLLSRIKSGHIVLLTLIVLVFIVSRLAYIQDVPGSVYWDEASIGYNAYSISTDLRDEWGDFLPVHFRAFGEFKLPVYIYSTAVAVKIFGLNAFAVRFPAVLFSLGSVVLVYLIVRRLFDSNIGLLALFYLTFSPWFFIFSRTGYEATAGIFFLLLGIYAAVWAEKRKTLVLVSTLSWILSMYSYNSMRVVAPIVFSITLIYFLFKKMDKRYLVPSIVLMIFSFVPITRLLILGGATQRTLVSGEGNIVSILRNYVSHFSPSFLFSGDMNARSTLPGWGIIWPIDLLFVAFGSYALLKAKGFWPKFICALFLIGFVPAALAKEAPHALRSLTSLFPLAVIWSLGVWSVIGKAKGMKAIVLGIIIFVIVLSGEGYIREYFGSYNIESSESWQYAYKKLYDGYSPNFGKYNKIIIDDEFGQPYIFMLFYSSLSPDKYRAKVSFNPPNDWGHSLVSSYGNFEFKKVSSGDNKPGNLVFSTKVLDTKPDGEIYLQNGSAALYVYDNK